MKQLFSLVLSITIALGVFAQPSVGGLPIGLKDISLQHIETYKIPSVDNADLLEQDRIAASMGEKSLRFGLDFAVSIPVNAASTWQDVPNGRKLWSLEIKSQSAQSINLTFERFIVPNGTRMFVYNPDGSHVLGAFTERNMNKLHNFATLPVRGNTAILEISVPAESVQQVDILLSQIVHVYRDFYKDLKDFGSSGSCNNNVVCPVGDPWADQIRSSVMLLSGNFRYCSGAAINNATNDGTPYILTADHCDPGTTDIFMFNYQSPVCTPNQDGSTADVQQGCIIRARNGGSDFCLVELSSEINPNFNAYLSGWSRQDAPPASAVGIHHPAGDVKKITFNDDATDVGQFGGADCWHILDWEDGTTEGGSSGSPLYNENKQIIGQLYGGTASCGNNIDDYYGRLITSWNGNSASTRLRDWLDPTDSDVASIDGIEASVPQFAIDAGVQSIVSPAASYCNATSIDPSVKIRNNGTEPLTSCTISYGLAGTTLQTFDWTGNLATFESATVNLPSIAVNPSSNQQFQVQLSNPNNGAQDGQVSNNTSQVTFSVNQGEAYTLNLITDDYPDETGMSLVNLSTSTNIFTAAIGSISGPQTVNFCLPNGCYRFIIRDSYGDGICCGSGQGSFSLTSPTQNLVGSGGQFTTSDTILFCVGPTGILDLWNTAEACTLYPNPASGSIQIRLNQALVNEISTFKIMDITGRVIQAGQINQTDLRLGLENVPAGLYTIHIEGATGMITRKFMLN